MKKRILAMLLTFVMVVSMVPFSVFAADCAHSKTSHDIMMASCKDGYDKVVCDDCGATLSTTILEANEPHIIYAHINDGKCLNCNARCDHEDFEVLREEKATCALTGYIWKKCNQCGVEFNHETSVDENAHTYVNGKCTACPAECDHDDTRTDTTMATCAQAGSTKEICCVCNKVLSETVLERTNDHTFLPNHEEGKECVRCGANKQDVCEHDYETVKVEPGTCSMTGYAWEVCKLCGKEYNHETSVVESAHSFLNGKCTACFKPCACDMERLDIKMASCHEEGYRRVLCVKCSKVLSETTLEKTNEHLFLPQYENGTKCRLCDARLQDVCDHDFETVRELAGTCIEAGYIWQECKVCGYEQNHETELDPDGHDYNIEKREAATCEDPAHVWKRCILCAYRMDCDEGEALGHTYENGKCFCGEPDPNCPHTNHVEDTTKYRAATCTVDGVRVYNCPACGTEQRETIAMLGHVRVESVSAPSCTVAGTKYTNCTRCNTLLSTQPIPATGHTFIGGSCACGAADPDACIHPQNLRDTYTQAATCTAAGYTEVTCRACNDVVSRVEHSATGHSMEERVVAPTCTQNGRVIKTCTTCHAEESKAGQAATGHDFEDRICKNCGTTNPNKVTKDYQDIYHVG